MRILILSRNSALYSTRSLLRACYRRGHQAKVIDHLLCDLIIEQGKLSVSYQGELLEGYDAVIPRIGSSVTTAGTNVVRQFEKMGLFSTTRADAILRARNKLRCFQILAAEGIDVPKSLFPNFVQIDEQLIDDMPGEQSIVKLLESTHGLGVILSESLSNAVSTIEAFQRMKHKVLVQEFIAESSGTDIRALVVDGHVVASMKRTAAAGEFRSNLHRGGSARIEKLTEQERFLARKVCRILGLDVAGVDILRSNRGPLVLEVNSSPGLEGIETYTRIDVAGEIVHYLEKRIRKHKAAQQKKRGTWKLKG
ncbi:MAG: RimK family alpha-L-glutamate ligase [Saprospiraceae bacterium]|nr:RimK family alpha-L-glutamate ligase [Saprospiraceae bacterium]